MVLYPVILAGGSGTRLWPLSRESYPKQFLPLISERTMFQDTLSRLDGMEGVGPPTIVCNEVHRFLVTEQMSQIQKGSQAVILEPIGRNTAPALTLAALSLLDEHRDSSTDPLILAMPADAIIRDVAAFQAAVRAGMSLAESGYLVTFGVVPDAPETGYGYIRKGEVLERAGRAGGKETASSSSNQVTQPRRLAAFAEKPDTKQAEAYVESGDYLWNCGIFMMRASVWLSELERQRGDIAESCRKAHAGGRADGEFFRPGADQFISCPPESIDYAVMEKVAGQAGNEARAKVEDAQASKAASSAVVPMNAGWSDVGAWSALWEERAQDAQGNVKQGDVYTHSTRNTLILAQNRLLATVGLEDVVVVETADAVLVASKDAVQHVKDIADALKRDRRPEQDVHRKVHRPWGSYEVVDGGDGFQVKRLTVNPGAALSLQMHRHRAEHWVVVRGTAKVTRGDEVFLLDENQSTYVPEETAHRLENPGDEPLDIIEVQSGSYLGEDDIVRFDDHYNRHRET